MFQAAPETFQITELISYSPVQNENKSTGCCKAEAKYSQGCFWSQSKDPWNYQSLISSVNMFMLNHLQALLKPFLVQMSLESIDYYPPADPDDQLAAPYEAFEVIFSAITAPEDELAATTSVKFDAGA